MKFRIRYFALILALVILGLPGLAGAEQRQSLHVGSEIGFPPYADIDAQGQSTGFSVELFAKVAEIMGIPVTFQPDNWDTVWQKLKTGKLDALPLVARLPEREGQVEFTETHTIGYDTFFVRKGHAPIKFIERARALSIIVLRSDASHDALANRGFNQQLVLVDSLADGFRLLASGQHDALLAPFLQGSMLLHKIGLEKIVAPGPLLKEYRREFCFAVRRGDTELRDRLNQGLAIVKANGEYDRLYRKWLNIDTSFSFPVKYAVWGAGIVAGLLALMGLWTWQLRRQVALRTAELAQAYTAVQAERQRLHDVLQALPAYVVLLTQDYKVAFANRFFEQRYGNARERACYEYLFNRCEPCEKCDTFKVMKTNAPLEWIWTGPDGHIYEIHDFPFTDTDGAPMILEVGIDITEMKRAKQALREANASLEQRVAERTAELEAARQEAVQARDLLRVSMDNSPALMSYVDKECRYRRANKNYELWFGYNPEQMYGHHVRDILGEPAWQTLSPYIERALAGEQVDFELQAPYLNEDRWVHTTYAPDVDAEGQVRGIVVHALDISERKRAEEALKEIDRRKDEFLAMLAHELRNPLAPISNAVQIMKRSDLDETRLAWCRDVINRQVEHLVRLVDDLLDVSRISRGKIELKKETLEVSTIVQRAIETSQPLIDARRHEFTVQLPPEPIYVEGDLVRLAQVVSNLLNNAAKYTDEGGRIKLTVEPADDDVFIRVRDNGRGIEPSALPSLFQLFYQVDRTIDRAEGGLGIGLALVKSLVAMHGGEVWASSEGRGKGSEFAIHLPCLRKSTVVATSCHIDAKPDEGPLRILVVDDNRDAAQSLSLLLTSEGHEVLLAYDGYAALEIAQAARPQVVLLDIGLPGMDGYAVARALRQDPALKMTHLIALSGYGREVDRETAKTAGFNGYLTKPVDFDELLCALARQSDAITH
ncbi:ATP-binding protein [Methylobacter sp. YRD-M1]|uniref:ATP-binding protein n=1 Tax=Methylobacter sp. YRD-M1 TaxID=2911520 RepID=UPI00227A4698|nr:transporter substrate-binding domain-containing protein [Methylobacter sp. YRD-M1]WAK03617.1 transporter substrate-binding domain-containing protein [Methylobacter sp. YRD-M1]